MKFFVYQKLIFLLWLASLATLGPETSLSKVTDQLAIIARIVNAIALQNEFSTNMTNDFLSELLDFQSADVVEKLTRVPIDPNVSNARLDVILGVKSLGKNPVDDSSKIKEGFRSLEAMKGKVAELESGARIGLTTNYESELSSLALDSLDQLFVESDGFDTAAEKLKTLHTTPAVAENKADFENAFDGLLTSLSTLRTNIFTLKSYPSTFSRVFKLKDKFDVLKPVKVISDVGKEYQKNMATIASMPTTMLTLKTDSDTLLPLANKHSDFKLASAELSAIVSELTAISAPRTSRRAVVSGFPNNGKDFDQMFKDFGSDWLKKNIAGGESVEKLENALASLKTWIPSLVKLEQTRQRQPMPSNLGDIAKSLSDTFKNISEEGKVLSQTTDLATSITTLSSSIGSLQPISGSPNFTDFDTLFRYASDVDTKLAKLHEVVRKTEVMVTDDILTALTSVENEVRQIGNNNDITALLACVNAIRTGSNFDGLVGAVEYIATNMKSLSDSDFAKQLQNPPSVDSIQSVQNSLAGTGLVNTLKALKTTTYNSDGIDKMIGFGISARQIQAAQGDITVVKNSIAVIDQLKTDVAEVKMAVTSKSSRRRRSDSDAVTIKNLKNSLNLASDFATSVNMLRKLTNAYQKRSQLTSAADSGDEVDTLIQSVPTFRQVWTDYNRNSLKTMVTQLESLEKFAEENKNAEMMVMGGIFEKAAEIKGVQLDTELIRSDVLPVMRNSTSSTVLTALPIFAELADLHLDFARHHSEIKAGMINLHLIQSFFDDFFGVKRVPPGEVRVVVKDKEARVDQLISIILVFIVLVAICLASGVIAYRRSITWNRQYEHYKKEKDPERWILLSFHHENVVRDGEEERLRTMIKVNDLAAFKTAIRNGYHVNSRSQDRNESTTLLHDCIQMDRLSFAKILIENGADMNLKNHLYETPMAMAKRLKRKKFVALFEKNKKKAYPKVVPELLAKEMYRVCVDAGIPMDEHKKDAFVKRFHKNCTKSGGITHYVVKTDSKNYLHVTEDNLELIFSPAMLINHLWMAACLKNSDALLDNKEWRVKGIKYNGKKYDTLGAIKDSVNRRKIPFLFGTVLTCIELTSDGKWASVKKVAAMIGSHVVTTPIIPQENNKGHMHYREDVAKQILIYRTPNYKDRLHNYIENAEHYSVFQVEEFIGFLLAYEVTCTDAEQLTGFVGMTAASKKGEKDEKKKNEKKASKKKGKKEKKKSADTTTSAASNMTGTSAMSGLD